MKSDKSLIIDATFKKQAHASPSGIACIRNPSLKQEESPPSGWSIIHVNATPNA